MSQQTGPTGPCGLTIKANNYEAWGFKIEDKGRGDPDSPFTVLPAPRIKEDRDCVAGGKLLPNYAQHLQVQ